MKVVAQLLDARYLAEFFQPAIHRSAPLSPDTRDRDCANISAMTVALRTPMTLDAFLDWEGRQETRYAFDGLQPVAMSGGARAHAAIQRNIALALGNRPRGKPCPFFGSDLKIAAAGSIRYPDGFVTCAPGASGDTIVHDPVVIFEVMSPSTAGTDTIVKNREYAATPSVRRYVLLAQDVVGGTMFEPMGDDWIGRVLAPDSIVRMPEIGIEAPIAEFYEGVRLAMIAAE
jgi:Uma2 family endonuclease